MEMGMGAGMQQVDERGGGGVGSHQRGGDGVEPGIGAQVDIDLHDICMYVYGWDRTWACFGAFHGKRWVYPVGDFQRGRAC